MKNRQIVNRTGKTNGMVNPVAAIWTDREPRTYVDICKRLKIGSYDTLGDLTSKTEIEFIKAFYPSFNENQQIATLLRKVDKSNGFPVYLIEIWETE